MLRECYETQTDVITVLDPTKDRELEHAQARAMTRYRVISIRPSM
jgi:hypothetical protein